jgi:hypothetical protein
VPVGPEQSAISAPVRNRFDRMEIAGAFGDLGTLVPFVVAYIGALKMDPFGVLFAFALLMIVGVVTSGEVRPSPSAPPCRGFPFPGFILTLSEFDPELNPTRRTYCSAEQLALFPDNHRSSSSHAPSRCRERLASGVR